jgi:rRNA-processing protein FCF1
MAGACLNMADTTKSAAICDANILIDYIDVDADILRELVKYWGAVYVPDRVLAEVHGFTEARAVELGLTIIESPLLIEKHPALSVEDSICLYFVIQEGWTCIANDKRLRRECSSNGGSVIWGFEMLNLLVGASQITKERALAIAERITKTNPSIPPSVLESFKELLE